MSDESRTEFQLWAETEFINGPLQYHGMYLGWHARDAEVNDLKRSLTIADVSLHTQVIANEALKARVEKAEAELKRQICPWCAVVEGEQR